MYLSFFRARLCHAQIFWAFSYFRCMMIQTLFRAGQLKALNASPSLLLCIHLHLKLLQLKDCFVLILSFYNRTLAAISEQGLLAEVTSGDLEFYLLVPWIVYLYSCWFMFSFSFFVFLKRSYYFVLIRSKFNFHKLDHWQHMEPLFIMPCSSSFAMIRGDEIWVCLADNYRQSWWCGWKLAKNTLVTLYCACILIT